MRNSTKLSKRPRGRPKKFDETEVLDTIMRVFWEHGFGETSLDTLSEATHVARPSLYATFGDKEEMYLASLRNYRAQMGEAIMPAVEKSLKSGASAQETLLRVFHVLIDIFTDHGEAARGCLIFTTAATEAFNNERIRAQLRELLDGLDARFARILEQAHAADASCEVDPKTTAPLLGAVAHTLAVRARAGQKRKDLRKLAASAIEELLG